MRASYRTLATLLAAVMTLGLAGCADGDLDDADGPDSVLEVETVNLQPADGTVDPVTLTCGITITDARVNLRNRAKSAGATVVPFNDIVMETVTIDYRWDDLALSTPQTIMDIGGTVPAQGSLAVTFPPILLGNVDCSYLGHSANLNMTFTGRQVSGARANADGGGVFSINVSAGTGP